MTKFVKKAEVSSNWFEIDAKNAIVGRLASVISKIIRGKNKTHSHLTWTTVILLL